MKKLYSIIFIVLLSFTACSEGDSKKKDVKNITSKNTIAIGKFILSGNTSQSQYSNLLADFRSYIDDSFSKNSKYKTINKQRVDEILATNGLYESVKIKKRGTRLSVDDVKKYKEANAEYVLLGEIKNFDLDVLRGNMVKQDKVRTLSKKHMVLNSYVSISIIHVDSQEIVAKENLKIKEILPNSSTETLVTDALTLLSEKIVSKLLISLSGEIKVISMQNDEIVLNKGSQDGITKDMKFDIFKIKNIEQYSSQQKIASVEIIRTDKEISFAKLINIIELPKNGSIAKLNIDTNQNKVIEKIRIAIADTTISQSSLGEKKLKKFITSEMEYLLSQDSSFVITKNDMKEYDSLLAQQLLTNLSNGREPGLPMGSLKGVDYLVFTSIDYVYYQGEKVSIEHIESLEIDFEKKKKANSSMSGYVYLVDVNTGNRISSIPLDIKYEFENTTYASQSIKSLAKEFSKKAISSMIKQLKPMKILKVVSDSTVILNVGKNVGLKINDKLNIFGKNELIIDEDTGITDTLSGVKIGLIKIIDFTRNGKAVAQIVNGRSIFKGLSVEPVSEQLTSVQNKKTTNLGNSSQRGMNSKKYVVIKKPLYSEYISKYKRELVSKNGIANKIREKINNTNDFSVLSRNKNEIKALFEEKQLANSDISDDFDTTNMRLTLSDYIVLPKVNNIEILRTSKQIPNIDSFENKDFIKVEMSLVFMDTKGHILYEDSKSKKYSSSWASENKLKSKTPSRNKINKLVSELTSTLVDDFIKNKQFN